MIHKYDLMQYILYDFFFFTILQNIAQSKYIINLLFKTINFGTFTEIEGNL